jgi:hypothetical protein
VTVYVVGSPDSGVASVAAALEHALRGQVISGDYAVELLDLGQEPDLLFLCCTKSTAINDPASSHLIAARKFQRQHPGRVFVRMVDAPAVP